MRATALSWLQPTYLFLGTGNTQHHDSEYIIQTSMGITLVLTKMCIAIAMFW